MCFVLVNKSEVIKNRYLKQNILANCYIVVV